MSSSGNQLSIVEPDKKFAEYMAKTLLLEERKAKKKQLGQRITDTSTKYNADRKGNVLKTYVSKSIANLTYFFRFINEHPVLIKNFDKDIEKILGLNMPIDSKKAPFTSMLREFIGQEYFDTIAREKYHMRLLQIMQFLIRRKADWIGRNLNDPPIPTQNDYEMLSMMISDLKRAETWIGYLDQSISRISSTMISDTMTIKAKTNRPNCRTVIPKMKEKFPKKLRF